jgi:3-hydroxypropanoate dehydrogenase
MKAQKTQKTQKTQKVQKKSTTKTTLKKSTRSMTSTADLKHELSFRDAFVPERQRTYRNWSNKKVDPDAVKKAFDVIKYGPTAFNSSPLRIALIQTPEAKAKFSPALMAGNVPPMMSAPLTAILAYDSEFDNHFDFLSPGYDGPKQYLGANPDAKEPTAKLNASLQAGYFLAALRTQGLDLGPANGFNNAAADQTLFSGNPKTKSWKSFMYVNIGHADPDTQIFPRSPRFEFETVSVDI